LPPELLFTAQICTKSFIGSHWGSWFRGRGEAPGEGKEKGRGKGNGRKERGGEEEGRKGGVAGPQSQNHADALGDIHD